MDYIFLSAIVGITLLYLTISYDVACQWKVNLWARIAHMPPALQIDSAKIHVQFGVPIWHASAHESSCQAENSMGYQKGVGRACGEGIERTWSKLNGRSSATKEMGPGGRHDTLDDAIGRHNWEKNIGFGKHLPITGYVSVTVLTQNTIRRFIISEAFGCDKRTRSPGFLLSGGEFNVNKGSLGRVEGDGRRLGSRQD